MSKNVDAVPEAVRRLGLCQIQNFKGKYVHCETVVIQGVSG